MSLFGGSALAVGAAAWAVRSSAQERWVAPLIGVLAGGLAAQKEDVVRQFRKGLLDSGLPHEPRFEVRQTEHNEQLAMFAAELVGRPVDLLFATGNANAAQAAKGVTSATPIVFSNGGDPVKLGLVAAMNRPGGMLLVSPTIVAFSWQNEMPPRCSRAPTR
ncbi:MAG: ABC transporter substrate binding protein [Xanthobacteraceae bacterium]